MSDVQKVRRFRKRIVVMEKGIVVFEGVAATGRLASGAEFSIVCPDAESCEQVWQLVMPEALNHERLQKIVMCQRSDIEMDVTPSKMKEQS